MAIVDDQQRWSVNREGIEQVDGCVEEPQPLGLGVECAWRRDIVDPASQVGNQSRELATAAIDVVGKQIAGRIRDDVSQDLDPGSEGSDDSFVAATSEHPGSLVVCVACQLRAQARLTDPRFSADQGHESALDLGGLPVSTKGLSLVVASREWQLARDGEER